MTHWHHLTKGPEAMNCHNCNQEHADVESMARHSAEECVRVLVEQREELRGFVEAERDEARKNYFDLADAVCRESASVEDACRQARETRAKLATAVDAMKRHVVEWGDLAETAIIREALRAIGEPGKEPSK